MSSLFWSRARSNVSTRDLQMALLRSCVVLQIVRGKCVDLARDLLRPAVVPAVSLHR